MTKLREISAKHAHTAARAEARAAHLMTRVDKLRHAATSVREKSEKIRATLPALQGTVAQLNAQIQAATRATSPGTVPGSDVTKVQVRARKYQQKVADHERKAAGLELRAAKHTQKASVLKTKADRLLEIARSHEQESQVYRNRADQLQLAAEGRLAPTGSTGGAPPVSPQ
jgi:predicted  nucleic acid-binding Zn-ribbon protein